MKIFNWMHRKLHPSMSYSQVSQKKEVFGGETEKEEMVRQRERERDRDTEALLLHDMLDGILTIGTLGHGHPCHVLFSQSNSPQEESLLQKEQEKYEEEEQQVLGAVAAFVVEERSKPMAVSESSLVKSSPFDEEEDKKMVQMMVNEEEAEKLLEEPLLKNKEKREKGRTTLAELFAADASMESGKALNKSQIANPATRSPSTCPKTNTQHKKKGVNSPQTNTTTPKLHRLLTRMLKKKIHPELNERSTTGHEVPLMTARVGISSRTEVV